MPTVSPAYTSWLGADTSPVDKDDARTYLAALEATISPMREVLTANRTYYVRTDGSDSNTGLANTAGGAFLTLQAAINAAASIDISIYTVTISVAAGTYSSGVITLKACVGAGEVVITGDTTTPGNVIISSSGNAFSGTGIRTVYTIRGFALRTSNSSAYCFDL
jgi:pectin methylesterase-like acyl-CoA thioesterase